MSNSEKKDESDSTPPTSPPNGQSQSGLGRAQADNVTLGDEAQKQRDKMQRQEKAEGDRR